MFLLILVLVALTTPFCLGQYDYAEVLGKSILFYEAQESGWLEDSNRIWWRSHSCLADGWQDRGFDLKGGWFDAGDYVKFGFPMASSVTVLAWGLVEFRGAYENSGELQNMLNSLKVPLDYFIRCHTTFNDPGWDEFYGQVGDGEIDHAWWGRPEELDDIDQWRPASYVNRDQPGSDLVGETAAAMAASSMAFRPTDAAYADILLDHARQLYEFAFNYRGFYDDVIEASDYYGSTKYEDELVLGAMMLWKATGDWSYVDRALGLKDALETTTWGLSWDSKDVYAQLLLFEATGDSEFREAAERYITAWRPGGGIHYTPKGLAWRLTWGALRYSANTAFFALLARKQGIMPTESLDFARSQLHYMLGDAGRSYVVGYGNNPPQRPHHASSSCNPDHNVPCNWDDYNRPEPNPSVLNGALVGGPDENDWYEDRRDDYIANEVACDYNAGFQSALAGMIVAQMNGDL